MTYNFWLEGRKIDESKLLDNGFSQNGNVFCKRIDLPNGIYIEMKVVCETSPSKKSVAKQTSTSPHDETAAAAPKLLVDVFDAHLNKKYAQYYNGHGGIALKAEVREKVTETLKNCLIYTA